MQKKVYGLIFGCNGMFHIYFLGLKGAISSPVKTGYAGFCSFRRFPVVIGVDLTKFCKEPGARHLPPLGRRPSYEYEIVRLHSIRLFTLLN
jgi:hypothetical protein